MADRMGTKYLQETLNAALYNHIKEKLPGIRANLQAKKRVLQDQIAELGGLETKPPSRMAEFTKYELVYQFIPLFVLDQESLYCTSQQSIPSVILMR